MHQHQGEWLWQGARLGRFAQYSVIVYSCEQYTNEMDYFPTTVSLDHNEPCYIVVYLKHPAGYDPVGCASIKHDYATMQCKG